MHAGKMVAPIIIVVFAVSYYAVIGISLIRFNLPVAMKAVVLIVSCLVSLILVYVLVERIKEIRRGEEDDLGKY